MFVKMPEKKMETPCFKHPLDSLSRLSQHSIQARPNFTTAAQPLGDRALVTERPPLASQNRTFASVLSGSISSPVNSIDVGCLTVHRGEPSLRLTRQEMLSISQPFSNSLVGRFAAGRPPMESICKFIISLGLKGECPVGLLDQKHVLLRPTLNEDFTRLWCRRS